MTAEALQLWGIVALLAVVVLVIMLWPLIRRREANAAPREAYDINVYKDQLLEIDADLERGLLNSDQAEAARTEIKRRMLAAADSSEVVNDTSTVKSNKLVISVISICVPLGAVLLYLGIGNPDMPDQPLGERKVKAHVAQPGSEQNQDMMKAVTKLAKHLETSPDDLRGWVLLGRTYLTQGKYSKAASAYGQAYSLSEDDPDIIVDYAEASTLAADSQISEEVSALFTKALVVDASNPKARYYLGLYKAQQGDIKGAMQGWIDLATMSPPNAPWVPVLKQQIGRAAKDSGIDPASIQPSSEAKALAKKIMEAVAKAQPEQAAAPAPTNEDVKAAMGLSEGDRNKMIRSMVEQLADKMKEDPNNKEGWVRLERAYRVLGETALADEAAANAARLP